MFRVCGTTITLVRGDTFIATVNLFRGDEPYIPSNGDTIRFAACRTAEVTPRLVKTIPYDTMELRLLPEDTKDLPIGLYKYDMEIELEDGSVDTFISHGQLNLLSDICRE